MQTPESLLLLKLTKAVKELKSRKLEKGDPGRDPTAEEIYTAVSLWMEFHRDQIRGKPGLSPKAVQGPSGVGIDDILIDDDEIVITLTNGKQRKFKLPYRDESWKNRVFLGASGLGNSIRDAEIGEVRLFRFAPSTAWLPLAGGTYEHDEYPLLGALYGSSQGETFTVEDARGRALYATEDGIDAGTSAGSDEVDLSHNHGAVGLTTNSSGAHAHGAITGESGSVTVGPPQLVGNINVAPQNHTHSIGTDGAHTHNISGSTAAALTNVDKRPARLYLTPYIRAI